MNAQEWKKYWIDIYLNEFAVITKFFNLNRSLQGECFLLNIENIEISVIILDE
jgi:hypothetical protein